MKKLEQKIETLKKHNKMMKDQNKRYVNEITKLYAEIKSAIIQYEEARRCSDKLYAECKELEQKVKSLEYDFDMMAKWMESSGIQWPNFQEMRKNFKV